GDSLLWQSPRNRRSQLGTLIKATMHAHPRGEISRISNFSRGWVGSMPLGSVTSRGRSTARSRRRSLPGGLCCPTLTSTSCTDPLSGETVLHVRRTGWERLHG